MDLPDWTTGIQSQISTFLAWDTVATLVQIIVGIVVATMILNLFMKAVTR